MTFSRTLAIQNARTLTAEELDQAVRAVCASFDSRLFPGITSVVHAREMIDILAHEQQLRDPPGWGPPTPPPLTRPPG